MKFFKDKNKKENKPKTDNKVSKEKPVEAQKTELQQAKSEPTVETPVMNEQTLSKLKETLTNDTTAQKIIEIISRTKDGVLNPEINFEENKITYPLLTELGNDANILPKLEDLSTETAGILEKGIYERLPLCPDHPENLAATVRLYCSSCMSDDIKKMHLQEHKACGFISEQKLLDKQSDGTVKCISCKKTIKDSEKEVQKLGRWYECNECNTKFDNCVVKIHCRQFNHDFVVSSAEMMDIAYYKIKTDSKTLHGYSYSLLAPLRKILDSMNFVSDEDSIVKGKSGVDHKVSLYGHSENKSVLIDIQSSENMIEDSVVNAFMVKVMDVTPTTSILIGIPEISNSAKKMAESYKISVVTGNDFNQIIESVKKIVQEKIEVSPSN